MNHTVALNPELNHKVIIPQLLENGQLFQATMNLQPTDVEGIAGAIVKHGITPSAQRTLMAETFAAEESIASGLYVSWIAHPDCKLGPSAADEIKNRTGQCCRVSSKSICMCGHPLSGHDKVVGSKSGAYVRPPKCTQCKKCPGYSYAPVLPEECGQWWLSRRKDFNVVEWRKVGSRLHGFLCTHDF